MSYLTACQPGWLAVFGNVDGSGFSTEPIACWLSLTLNTPGNGTSGSPEVRPICALGSEVCDATRAANYIGVVGPGSATAAERLYTAWRANRDSEQRSA